MARGRKRKIEEEPAAPNPPPAAAPAAGDAPAPPLSLNRTRTMQETLSVAKEYLKRAGFEAVPPAGGEDSHETRSKHPKKEDEQDEEEEEVKKVPAVAKKLKGKAVVAEPQPPLLPALSILNRSRSIQEFYTDNAGKHEVPAGGYGEAEMDLGKNNAFSSFSILLMNFNREAPLDSIFALAHESLSLKGFSVVEVNTEEELLDYVHHFDEIWIASSDQPPKNGEKILQELRKFHAAGKGIGLFAGGDPYVQQANLLLKDLLQIEVTDSYAGEGNLKLAGLGDQADKPSSLARSLITTGLTELPESGIYGRLAAVPGSAQVIARSHRNFPTILAWEGSSHTGRILLSLSLLFGLKDDDELVSGKRLLSNVGVWLLGLEDRMKLGLALVGDIQAKPNVQWEYFLERNLDGKQAGWHPYEDQGNRIVEAAYQKYVGSDQADNNIRAFITVHSGAFTYEVDFKTMVQKNIAHQNHKIRKIRRVGDVL